MPRDINSTVVTALESGGFKPFYAVFLDFMNGDTSTATPLYLWTGIGDLVSGGNTYQGTGALMKIDHLEESATLKANGITLTFNGITTSLLTAALAYEYSGRPAKVYFGIEGNSNLTEVFTGVMDVMAIQDSPENSQITINVENRLIDLERTNPSRYTTESNENYYSNDTFFSFIGDLQDKKIEWGPVAGDAV